MTHATVLVSVAELEVITKLVATVLAETLNHPGVPPSTLLVKNIRLLTVIEVTALVDQKLDHKVGRVGIPQQIGRTARTVLGV
jgi:hypothetical protein